MEKNEWHYLSCMQGHGGREISTRHHQVVATIERYAKLAGAIVVSRKNYSLKLRNVQIYKLL